MNIEAGWEWVKSRMDEEDIGAKVWEWIEAKLSSRDDAAKKSGWGWLEEKLGAKDESKMKKHTDDIDTILIVVRIQCLPNTLSELVHRTVCFPLSSLVLSYTLWTYSVARRILAEMPYNV